MFVCLCFFFESVVCVSNKLEQKIQKLFMTGTHKFWAECFGFVLCNILCNKIRSIKFESKMHAKCRKNFNAFHFSLIKFVSDFVALFPSEILKAQGVSHGKKK